MEKAYEVHFAPLQGYTDRIYRNTFDRHFGGISACYTPFIRLEKDGFRNKDLRDSDPAANTAHSLIPQILPGSPEELRQLAGMLRDKGYRHIDINFGCPFPPIACRGKGAGILPYPEKVKSVTATLEEFPEVNFSLKMRLGWENSGECMNLLSIINDLRLCWISIHARTGKQQYKGEVLREDFRSFYRECKHPLFYNGNLKTIENIRKTVEEFPLLRGVSIGRGLLSSPFMAEEFQKKETFTDEIRKKRFSAFHDELFSAYKTSLNDERLLLQKMKSYWEYFLPETDRKLLKRIRKTNKPEEYLNLTRQIFEY